MNFRFMNHYDLCRWHEINTGFESSQHIDGKKHIQGFLPQMFQLWDVFFFRCNKRRIGPSFPDLLDLKNPGFWWDFGGLQTRETFWRQKNTQHLGVSNKPSLKKRFGSKIGCRFGITERSRKKTRVKKRWWPRKRRWIPRPCKRAPGFSSDEFLVFRPMLSWLFEIFRNCSLTNICHLW